MKLSDLIQKKFVIWGAGREGQAVAHMLLSVEPSLILTFVDENEKAVLPQGLAKHRLLTGGGDISRALADADALIKSPGVSLYHPLIATFRARGGVVTSLLNLWFAEKASRFPTIKTICVSGTKGKSTTATLLTHMLNGMGVPAVAMGNIGVPLSLGLDPATKIVVIEMSSYQAANFDGYADLALITCLYPEHLDWHGSLEQYYRDKLNLLKHAGKSLADCQAEQVICSMQINIPNIDYIGASGVSVQNQFLARPHNARNVALCLAAIKALGFDVAAALKAAETYRGLPHRQNEIGEKNCILYVDDSISTTPQSAIAAMEVYGGKPIALIAGGHDRGIDYAPLVDYVIAHKISAVAVMGPSGERIMNALKGRGYTHVHVAHDMADAVSFARSKLPQGGVVLLSPAAPSYGLFKDYIARGEAFVKAIEV